ncbi:MAG: PHP domain-containing protein [Bacteroidota bacterium]
MSNREIANLFNLLADLMTLHEENPFKIRSYSNAYIQLRKLETPVGDMSDEEISQVKGIGKAIRSKIAEILETGKMSTLEEYKTKTPPGIQDMVGIKGLGPKKIRQLWKELEIESVGELLYACNENRLISLSGFGLKTQDDIKKKIGYFLQSKGKFLFGRIEAEAKDIFQFVKVKFPWSDISFTGAFRRRDPVLSRIDIIVSGGNPAEVFDNETLILDSQEKQTFSGKTEKGTPVTIHACEPEEFGSKLFKTTGTRAFLEAFLKTAQASDFTGLKTEQEVFEKAGTPYIQPELRETAEIIEKANTGLPALVDEKDIRSVLHSHTTYSDGLHSLREMAEEARDLGYEYIGITDHSKTAFYANGLSEERVAEQMAEIDELNQELAPFKIFKGIESDILYDGTLDYAPEVLEKFDFIIASIHSQLKMDKEKATSRLIAAIENPYTTILGHPTSRLLLSREGYPIDHKKVIDACAEKGVILELNANPIRLDVDYTWIPYAVEKGVKISVNPDAHSKEGIQHIKYGVFAARKGGLSPTMCFNSLNLAEFEEFLRNRRKQF